MIKIVLEKINRKMGVKKMAAKKNVSKKAVTKKKTTAKKATKTKSKTTLSYKKIPNNELFQIIQEKAYELFEKDGCIHGRDQKHWIEAETIVRGSLKQK